MKLLRLRLRGLRSFSRETEIDLGRLGEQGLFAISGPTGSGKSTILDGIFLALFGRCPRGDAGECVSAGALELSVRLEIEVPLGGAMREVAVERRFKWSRRRDAGAGAVGADLRGQPRHPPLRIEERTADTWTPVELGGQRADELLAEQIVKVSMSDFQQAVVLPQGEFDALLRAKPAERRTLVASLFRTEHLGQPLIDVLKAREIAVRGEMGRLEEVEREVLVREDEVIAAREEAAGAAAAAEEAVRARLVSEERAAAMRRARERCALRDAAAEALATVEAEIAARAQDRARVERARRATGAQAAVQELARVEAAVREAESRARQAEEAERRADAARTEAARALSEASAARAAELPRALEQLGRARQALERGRDLGGLDAAKEARARELAGAEKARAAAARAEAEARGRLDAAETEEKAAAEQLDRVRVGEDERAETLAAAAVAEHAAAEDHLGAVIRAELGAAEGRVQALAAALAAAEESSRAAAIEAERFRAELRRLELEAQRAAAEVEVAELRLVEARRAAAAADLWAALAPGEPCPVCGAREHPGGVHRLAATAISAADRALSAERRSAKAAEQARAEAAREAAAGDEGARAAETRVETTLADLEAARQALALQASGDEVPPRVAEARVAVERLATRAEVGLGVLATEARERVRDEARRAPKGAAEARVAALGRRAREAEQVGRTLAAARERAALARIDVGARGEALDQAARERSAAEGRAAAAAELARARREEIEALIADLSPGKREKRTAAAWVAELEARTASLEAREEGARAALEEVRERSERLSLLARDAAGELRSLAADLARTRAAAEDAIARAGFESVAALREALMDPASLDALAAGIERLGHELDRLVAVLAERRRDATEEVSEQEALAAERARDDARALDARTRERAVTAAARRDELSRRQARAAEIRAQIDGLSPRAQRLGQIRQVVGSNQLSELAAERHLAAVTRGAAALLASLSNDRYALVRTADGAFAVADAAHGGIVRPPSTLSGGETFLVSLSLSLALSERIQLAGRTRFDFFFLDEGFGSLDQAMLETALGALERLRGPNRVIGMISHVPAIEERMPRRLRVSTARQGGPTTVVLEP